MMKIQRIRMIWMAAVLLAAGCSQEEVTDKEMYSDVLIAPRSSVADGKIRPLPDDGATRAAVDGITQELTFYFLRANETGVSTGAYEAYGSTVLPAVRAAGTGAQPLTFTPPILHLSSGAKSKLTGWYPEATSVTGSVPSWTLDGTQDVMTAAAQAGSKTSPMPILEFQHRLSQLHFRFQAESTTAQAVWGTITDIRVVAQPTVCRYTPETDEDTGNVTFDAAPIADFEAKNIKTGVVPTTPTAMSDPMMIVPQTATELIVTVESEKGKWAMTKIASGNYEAGKAYNINILLEESEIAGSATLGNWASAVDIPQAPIVPVDKINLSEAGTANCYLVTIPSKLTHSFDATVRGNGYEKTTDSNVSGISYGTLPDLATAKEARVLWQTGTSATTGLVVDPATLKLEDGVVKFSLGDAVEGNAVIGLFASNDPTAECLWSWHIWRVNGPLPADVACVKTPSPTSASKNFKMMALNLGAFHNTPGSPKSIGLYYQWGRKDPFPGPKDFTKTEPTNIYGSISNYGTVHTWNGAYSIQTAAFGPIISTEAWAVQYPGVFITNSTNPYDWMYYKNDYLWGTPWVNGGVTLGSSTYNNNQGVKSIYDPCPVGYRVPPQDTWNKAVIGTWTNGQAFTGMVSSGSFYFPASGYRIPETGAFGGIGTGVYYTLGRYWSSSSRGSGNVNGSSLDFGSLGVGPLYNANRAYGLQVRCVAE